MGDFLKIFREVQKQGRTGSLEQTPVLEGSSASAQQNPAVTAYKDPREQAIIDSRLKDTGNDFVDFYSLYQREKQVEARRQQRAYAEQAPPEVAAPVKELLSSSGDRNKVLDIVRKMTPEQREETLRLAPGIAQQLGDDRGGAIGRTLGALSLGVSKGVSQPLMELLGAGGTKEEIEYIRKLDALASQEFAPARPGDPWYESGPLQAAQMTPWMATIVGAGGLGRVAGQGAGTLLARGAAAGVPGAKAAFQAAGAVGRVPTAIGLKGATTKGVFQGAGTLAGITSAAFPGQYAQEVDQLKEIGMEDDWKLRLLAGGTATVAGLVEGIVPNPFGGTVSLKQGAMKAARQYLWESLKKAPPELGEEYLQGVTSGLGQHVAQYIDKDAKEKTIADAFANGWEQTKEAALPMAFLLGVPAVGGAGLSSIRARRYQLEQIRAKNFVSESDAKAAGIEGNSRRERMANVESEIEQLGQQEAEASKQSDQEFINQQQAGVPQVEELVPFEQEGGMTDEEFAATIQAQMDAQGGNVSTPAPVDTATVPPVVPQPTVQQPLVQPPQPAVVQPPVQQPPQAPPTAPTVQQPQVQPLTDKEFFDQQAGGNVAAPEVPTAGDPFGGTTPPAEDPWEQPSPIADQSPFGPETTTQPQGEIPDAGTIRSPQEEVRQEEGSADLRGSGQEQVRTQPESQEPPAQAEVQVGVPLDADGNPTQPTSDPNVFVDAIGTEYWGGKPPKDMSIEEYKNYREKGFSGVDFAVDGKEILRWQYHSQGYYGGELEAIKRHYGTYQPLANKPESQVGDLPEPKTAEEIESLPKFSLYRRTMKGKKRIAVRGDGARGGGDTLHDTLEDAQRQVELDRRNAEDKLKRDEAFRRAQEQEAKAEQEAIASYQGFDADKPLQFGKSRKSLEKQLNFTGMGIMSRKAAIERLVGEGWRVVEEKGEKYLERPDGRGNYGVSDLGKTGIRYAEHVIARREREEEKPSDLPVPTGIEKISDWRKAVDESIESDPTRASSIMRRVAQRTSDDAEAQEILDRLPDGLADRSQVAWDIGSNRKLGEPVRRRAAKWHKEYGLGGNLDAVIDKNPSAKPSEQPSEKPDRKAAIRKTIEEQGGFEANSADDVDSIRNKLYDGADTPTGTEIRAVMEEMKIEAGRKAEAEASNPAEQPAPESKTATTEKSPAQKRDERLDESEEARLFSENFIKIVADDVSKIRKQDIYRLLSEVPSERAGYFEWWLIRRRPDLAGEINEASNEILAERASQEKPAAEQPQAEGEMSVEDFVNAFAGTKQPEPKKGKKPTPVKAEPVAEEKTEYSELKQNVAGIARTIRASKGKDVLLIEYSKHYYTWSIRSVDSKQDIAGGITDLKRAKNVAERIFVGTFDSEADKRFTITDTQSLAYSNQKLASLWDDAGRAMRFVSALRDTGFYTDGRVLVKVSEKDRDAILKSSKLSGEAFPAQIQGFIDSAKKLSSYSDNEMSPAGYRGGELSLRTAVLKNKTGQYAIVDKAYHDTIMKRHPSAKIWGSEDKGQAIKQAVLYTVDGEPVGVLMPMTADKEDKYLAALLEGKYEDVKPTEAAPPKKPRTLKKEPKEGVKEGLDKAKEGAKLFIEGIKDAAKGNTPFANIPMNEKIARGLGMMADGLIEAGKYKFVDFIDSVVELVGIQNARSYAKYLEAGWNKKAEFEDRLDKSQSVLDLLEEKETQDERDDGALPDDTGDVEKNETEPNKKPRKRRGSGGSSASGKRRNTKSRRDNEATGDGSNADSGGNRDGVSSPAGSLNNHRIGERPVWLEGGAVTKLNRNIDSIETMQVVEREGRRATPEEQSVIAQYTGWGHLKQFFIRDSDIFSLKAIEAKEWRSGAFDRLDQITEQRIREQAVRKGRTETQILAKIQREQATNKHRVRLALSMTPAEYAQARKSTRYSHYTDPAIARSMWKFLENVLPEAGKIRVLEPSEGSGMFWGTMPDSMFKRAEMHGIDMDTASSRVSKHLYPSVRHLNIPYQQSPYPEGFFDVAITNVPFNKNPVTDATEDIEDLSLHNYYFAKTAKRVREGGVVAFITTHFTMDAAVPKQREAISAQGLKFLGAVRLHQDAFGGIANTKVVTDIIIMQKVVPGLPEMELNNGFNAPARTSNVPYLGNLLEGANVFFHPYFRDKPNMIAGAITANGEMRGEGPELTVESEMTTEETAAFVDSALRSVKIDKEAFIAGESKRNEMTEEAEGSATFVPEHLKDLELGRLEVDGGRLVLRTSEDTMTIVRSKFSPTMQARAEKWFAIRDAMVNLRILQRRDDNPVEEIEKARKKLNKVYDDFVGKFNANKGDRGDYEGYKPLNTPYNKSMFSSDFTSSNILALENTRLEPTGKLDKNGNEIKVLRVEKASIFKERNEWPLKHRPKPGTVLEALARSLFVKGGVDVTFIAESLGRPKADVIAELEEYAFALPNSGGWEIKEVYLSGNIAQKLQIAEKAVEQDVSFTRNVNALKEVLPVRKSFDQLSIQINSPFMPEDVLQGFVVRELGLGDFNIRKNSQELGGGWIAVYDKQESSNQTTQDRDQYAVRSGTKIRRTGFDLLVDMMAGKPTIIVDEDSNGRMVPNAALINLAKTKRSDLLRAFDVYVRENQERMDYIAKAFNDRIGGYVKQNIPDWVVSLDGMAQVWKDLARPYQKVAIGKIALGGNTLLAHRVGYGKTLSGVAGVMEQIRLGVARKPVVVVPNHLTGQWAKSFADYYPSALIMAPLSTDFSKSKRQATMNRIMTGNWDAVIIPESSFKKLPMSSEYVQEFFQAQIAQAIAVIEQATADAGSDPRTIVELENIKERLENNMAKYLAESQKDPGPFFDEMGVDSLMVDEAHHYKNLPFYTQNTRIAGINPTGSQQAFDMLMKTDFINNLTGSRNVTFLTGTPIANSMTEAWVMMRYLMPEAMKDAGVFAFDDWKTTFGAVVDRTRVNTIGTGFRTESRFQEFVNIEALSKMFQQVADVQMVSNDVEVPPVSGGKPRTVVVPASDAMKNFMLGLAARGENMPDDPSIDNMLNVMTVGAGAAIDFRLLDAAAMPAETSKLQVAADEVSRVYDMTTPFKGTQIIWSDRGVPKAAKKLTPEMKELGAWMRQQVESRPITMDEVKEKWKEIRPTKGAADELRRFMSMALQDMNFTEATDEDSDAYKVDIPDEPSVYVKDITDVDPNITEQAAPPWNVYQEMKSLLVARGVPSDQIVFIHDYKTAAQKVELFRKMNAGELRILIGNTPRLGTGANIQERLVAAHHLDVPWRPADVEQRDGRIIRSGNRVFAWGGNKGYAELAGVFLDGVMINRYVTEGSIDARYWDTNEMKAKMLQDFWSDSPGVSMEELGATTLSMAEVKAAAVANPLLREKIELETRLGRLEEEYRGALQSNAQTTYRLEDAIRSVADSKVDLQAAKDHVAWFNEGKAGLPKGEVFAIVIDGKTLYRRDDIAEAIESKLHEAGRNADTLELEKNSSEWAKNSKTNSVNVVLGTVFGKPIAASVDAGFRNRETGEFLVANSYQESKIKKELKDGKWEKSYSDAVFRLGDLPGLRNLGNNPQGFLARIRNHAEPAEGVIKAHEKALKDNERTLVDLEKLAESLSKPDNSQIIDVQSKLESISNEIGDEGNDQITYWVATEELEKALGETALDDQLGRVDSSESLLGYVDHPDHGLLSVFNRAGDTRPPAHNMVWLEGKKATIGYVLRDEKGVMGMPILKAPQGIGTIAHPEHGELIVYDRKEGDIPQRGKVWVESKDGKINFGYQDKEKDVVMGVDMIRVSSSGGYPDGIKTETSLRTQKTKGEDVPLSDSLRSAPDVLHQTQNGDVHSMVQAKVIELGIAANKAGVTDFEDFIAYSVKTVGEEQTRFMGGYLQLAATRIGMKGVRPVKDILGVPMTQEQYVQLAKQTFVSVPGEQVEAGIEAASLVLPQMAVGFSPAGTTVSATGLMQGATQTDTPAFKKWFGDSKVVDENGNPLEVYHGTGSTVFSVFDSGMRGENTGAGNAVIGDFFTDDLDVAENVYAGRRGSIVPVYLAIKNPRILRDQTGFDNDPGTELRKDAANYLGKQPETRDDWIEYRDYLIRSGYDGIEFSSETGDLVDWRDVSQGNYDQVTYITFKPTQIKSSTGNRGTFDPNNPNMLYQEGKQVDADTIPKAVLSKMSGRLRSMGYDSRGAEDVRRGIKERSLLEFNEDWIAAYQFAIGSEQARQDKAAAKKDLKNVNWARLSELGTTSDPNEAGYIKPDGELADFSGKREGGQRGTRSFDHREAGGTAGMQEVIAYGWVRMDENSGSLDIAKMPTPAQLSAITRMAQRKFGEIVLDLEDGLGEWRETDGYYINPRRRWSQQYPEGTKPQRIINDIKKFFGGDTPNTLFQTQQQGGNVKGWTKFISGTRALIGATSKADISTVIHEFAHPIRRFLLDRDIPQDQRADITDEEISMLEEKCGVKDGVWDVQSEEKLARMWELYWFEGKSPNAVLKSLFEKISRWMHEVYTNAMQISGARLDDDVRKLFDKLVQRNLPADQRVADTESVAPQTSRSLDGPVSTDLTSIKNEVAGYLAMLRNSPGLVDVAQQTQQEWLDEAAFQLSKDSMLGDRLVKELNANARNLSNIEVAILQLHSRRLNNALETASVRLFTAVDAKDSEAAVRARVDTDMLINHLEELDKATKKAGREWGRAGVARQIMLERDFSLAAMLRKARVANAGYPLSKNQLLEIEALAKKVADLEGKLAKEQQKTADLERQLALKQSVDDAIQDPENKPTRSTAKQKATDKMRGFVRTFANVFKPKGKDTQTLQQTEDEQMAEQAEDVIRAYVDSGVFAYGQLLANLRKDIGEELPLQAQRAFAAAWAKIKAQGEIPAPVYDRNDLSGLTKIAREIQAALVEGGIVSKNDPNRADIVLDAVHESLMELDESITKRETIDALSGYGQFTPLSPDENKKLIRDINGQLLQMAKIEDLEAKTLPRATGPQRREMSNEERELVRKVNELKRTSDLYPRDAEGLLKTAIGAAMTAARNRIVDLRKAIAKGEPIKKTQVDLSSKDADLAEIRRELAEVTREYQAMFPRPKATQEQRLAAAERGIDRAIANLEEQIRTGDVSPKARAASLTSPQLEAKQAKLKALRAQRDAIRALQNPKMSLEKRQELAYIANLENRIADYQDRTNQFFFGPKPKKAPRKLSQEEIDLKRQLEDVKERFFRLAAEFRLSQMSPKEKAWDYTKEASYLARAIMTSFDLSAVFRQGGPGTFSHPKLAVESAKEMRKALFSQAVEFEIAERMQEHPSYDFWIQAGLDITANSDKIQNQEEAYSGRLVRDGIGKKGTKLNTLSKAVLSPVKASGRAYTTYLNGLRFRLAKYFEQNLGAQGQLTLDEAKVIARFINVSTGRSDLGSFNKVAASASTVLFAPRYMLSRFQYLAMPFYLLPDSKVSGRVRKLIAAEYARHALGVMGFLGTAVAFGSLLYDDDDEEKPTVELDPRSSDFMKLKIGETRIDPLSGFGQVTTFMTQVALGQKKTMDGEIRNIRGEDRKYGDDSTFDVIANFGRKKLAPVPGAGVNLIAGEDVVGNKATPFSVTTGLFIPLAAKEVLESLMARGVPEGPAIAMLNVLGMSGGTYGPKTKYKNANPEERKKLFEKDLKAMEWDSKDPAYSQYLTNEQVQQVSKQREARKQSLVYAAAASPNRKDYRDTETFEQANATREKALDALIKSGMTLDECRQLLIDYYKRNYGSAFHMQGGRYVMKESLTNRLRQIRQKLGQK